MQYSKKGLALTEQFEGCRLAAYQDSGGRWTVGYGHTAGVTPNTVITSEEAEAFLVADIAWAESLVNKLVSIPLTQGEFDALVDFVFNVGSGNFAHSRLLQLVNEGQFEEAAKDFEKWDQAGGIVVAGLLRRRIAEKNEFKS